MTSPLAAFPGQKIERRCAWCGEPFKTRREIQRFCSKSHRVLYAQWKKKQQA